ncbi:hypothetical protein Mal33_36020 [Rosistilla oblonga]|uniref:Uncharacterized protein n=1 Tax=Rosistilla oblonga TaxID=2527990 RepID=A0A518IWX9_9BACT|nr:hypothetical protein Mal33_36020 [Rosistilla oblonga]
MPTIDPAGITDGSRWFEQSEHHRKLSRIRSMPPTGSHKNLRPLRERRPSLALHSGAAPLRIDLPLTSWPVREPHTLQPIGRFAIGLGTGIDWIWDRLRFKLGIGDRHQLDWRGWIVFGTGTNRNGDRHKPLRTCGMRQAGLGTGMYCIGDRPPNRPGGFRRVQGQAWNGELIG